MCYRPKSIVPALFILLLILTACGGNEAEVAELPTRVVLPTNTASDTPTATNAFTATPTTSPTPSFTATVTRTPTITETPRPSATATPSRTPTLTRVPRTATFTLTPTFTPTATFTVTATPNLPQIINFGVTPNTAPGGSPVTLGWQTANVDSVRIDQLNAQGAVAQTFSVAFNGTLPVTLPNEAGQIVYRLVAIRAGQQVTRDVTVAVQLACAQQWFFGNQLAPQDAGCPSGPAVAGTGAVQPFERGLMIHVTIAQNRVYGLVYSPGSTTQGSYMVYDNVWDGTTTYTCPCGAPPAGLFDAQGVFNWLYNNTNGTTGPWWSASGVGWATTISNTAAAMTLQTQQQGTAFFLQVPGYGVIRFSGTPVTGTWTRLPGT